MEPVDFDQAYFEIIPCIEIGFIQILVSLGGGAGRRYTLDPVSLL